MALYWPHHNVALEIIDDPQNMPVDRDAFPRIKVVRATCAELSDPKASERLLRRLAREMGATNPAATPAERAACRQLLDGLEHSLRISPYLQSLRTQEAVEMLEQELDRTEREQTAEQEQDANRAAEAACGQNVA